MSNELFEMSLHVLMTLVTFSLLLCFGRLLRGPNVPNRTVAFDLISIHAVGIFVLFAVNSHSYVLLEGADHHCRTRISGHHDVCPRFGALPPRQVVGTPAQGRRVDAANTTAWRGAQMDPLTRNLIVILLASIGTLFLLVSALGTLRLPDVFTRMHAAGAASTLGISCLLLATGVHFLEDGQMLRMIALIIPVLRDRAHRHHHDGQSSLSHERVGPVRSRI